YELGQQLKKREVVLEEKKRLNKQCRDKLDELRSPRLLEARIKHLNLGLVLPQQAQIVRLPEPLPKPPADTTEVLGRDALFAQQHDLNPIYRRPCRRRMRNRSARAVGNSVAMVRKRQHRRLCWVAFFLGMAFTALGYRLVDLQVLRHEALSVEAQKNTRSAFAHEPRRGDIRDVRGNLWATSVMVKTVVADPFLLHDRPAEMARALAPLLEMNEADLVRLLQLKFRLDDKGKTLTNRFVVLKRKVPVESWQQIQSKISQLYSVPKGKKISSTERAALADLRAAITAEDGQQRIYPHYQLAAHVLGFVGSDEQASNGGWILSPGREGLELRFDKVLSGSRGWRVTEVDRRRREVVAFREQEVAARPGLNLVLTLDMRVQQILEEELAEAMRKHAPISATAIAVRPRTGEILALANLPTFDPNNIKDSTDDLRRNRAITDTAEPGSDRLPGRHF
ncbi:MAG: hypothetical protein DME26_14885, partial [Verrucomicrobia bacterium]